MGISVLNIAVGLLALEALIGANCQPAQEESYVQPNSGEDEDSYIYMDTRSETDPKQSETRRRSTLDRNFARFGRAGPGSAAVHRPAVFDYDGGDEGYADGDGGGPRRVRSGGPGDSFVRFGRGNSDFVRFGRVAAKHFIRFGRSVGERSRAKREAGAGEEVAKRAGGSNQFVRFGRRNDNFLRFGRNPEDEDGILADRHQQRSDYLLKALLQALERSRSLGGQRMA